MATKSVAVHHILPLALIDEAAMIRDQANAVLECLHDASSHLDSPEHVLPGITWLLKNQIARLKEIIDTTMEVRA